MNRNLFLTALVFAAGVVPARADRILVTGIAGGNIPQVNIFDYYNPPTQVGIGFFLAYENTFFGGVTLAVGDVNKDGEDDIVVAPGPGRDAEIRAFDQSGSQIDSFFDINYSLGFLGGVRVAVGDVDNDDNLDYVVATGPGMATEVNVYKGTTHENIAVWRPSGFDFGAWVAVGDLDADGYDDIVAGSDAGGSPVIKGFSVQKGAELFSFLAFDPGFNGGVRVGLTDFNDDGIPDIIAGSGPGTAGHVKIFHGGTQAFVASFFAFDAGYSGGIHVGGGSILTAPSSTGAVATRLRTYDEDTLDFTSFLPFGGYKGGVTFAASAPAAVPEPGAISLAALGLALLAVLRRRC